MADTDTAGEGGKPYFVWTPDGFRVACPCGWLSPGAVMTITANYPWCPWHGYGPAPRGSFHA